DGTDYGSWISCPTNVTIGNSGPSVSNVNLNPASPKTGDDLTANYDYTDPDSDAESGSEIIWFKDGVLQDLNDSFTVQAGNTNKTQEWHYKVRPRDGTTFGVWVGSTNVTIGNTDPIASTLNISPSNPVTHQNLTATYSFSDADGDGDTGSEIRWYRNGMLQVLLNDTLKVNSSLTTKGESWYFTVEPSDGTSFGNLQQASAVTIGNSAPDATNLQITPGSPVTDDTLTAGYSYADNDSDIEIGTLIIWYKNGVLQGGLNDSDTVDSSYTAKNDEWHFKVRPSDGTDYGLWTSCPTNITIENSPPTATNLQITPINPITSDDLIASYNWADNDTGDLDSGTEIRWYLNGVLQVLLNNTLTIGKGNTSKTDEWHFKVHPYDGTDFGVWVSSSTNVSIGNTPPEVFNVQINETSPVNILDDLHVLYSYTDYDSDGQNNNSREIRWYKTNGTGTYLMSSLNDSMDVNNGNTTTGDIWYFTIRVSDGMNLSSMETSASVSIDVAANQLPSASNLNVSISNPVTTDYLYINWTFSDPDAGDTESGSKYYWYRNGVYMSQYEGLQNLSSAATLKGEIWHVKVKPRDGKDFGPIVGVPTNVTIGNIAPTASSLLISPSNPKTGNDLIAAYTFSDIDSDAESGSKIIWYKNGNLQGALNGSSTVKAGNTTKNDTWHFKVQPNDGTAFGSWVGISTNVTIGNTAPSVGNLAITPSGAKTADEINAIYDFSDVDGSDSESGSYIRWFRNSIEIPSFENDTQIPSANTSKGQTWYFVIIPSDGSDFGSEKTSAAILILNTAPSASNLAINPSNPNATSLLSVSYVWTDPDNATDSDSGSLIIWYKDGQLQGALNNSISVASSYLSKGEEWHYKVRPRDGLEYGTWVSCPTNVTVINSVPTVSGLAISPIDSKTTNDLTASYTFSDVDSDAESGSEIIWYKNGALQGVLNDSLTVQAVNTTKNDIWHFKVRPKDGTDFGVWVGSSTNVTIGNTNPSVSNLAITPSGAIPVKDKPGTL
ncbi:MAG: hypothetical protein ACXACR_14055, partial [Candidatus Hodarchaeales archaeon]